jgi:hypothetical protein
MLLLSPSAHNCLICFSARPSSYNLFFFTPCVFAAKTLFLNSTLFQLPEFEAQHVPAHALCKWKT